MSRQIVVHDAARADVTELAYYIAAHSLTAADRFVEAVDAAFERLATMPGIGTAREYNNPQLRGMRMWVIPGFPKYLIFYRATDSELRIIRVLHGARDIARIFQSEDPDDQ